MSPRGAEFVLAPGATRGRRDDLELSLRGAVFYSQRITDKQIYNHPRNRAVDVSPRRKRTPDRSSPRTMDRVPRRGAFGGLEPLVLHEPHDASPRQSGGKLQLTAASPRQSHENNLTRLIPLLRDDANRLNEHWMRQEGKCEIYGTNPISK